MSHKYLLNYFVMIFIVPKNKSTDLELGRWLSGWNACSESVRTRVGVPPRHVTLPGFLASDGREPQSMLASNTNRLGECWICLSNLGILDLYIQVCTHAKHKHAYTLHIDRTWK